MTLHKVTIHFTYKTPGRGGRFLFKDSPGGDLFDRCIDFFDGKLKKEFKVDNFVMGSHPIEKGDYENL